MTYVDTPNVFLPDFFAAWPFNQFSAKQVGRIAAQLQLCSFRPGELIYPPKELPSVVHCVVRERVRILGPSSYQNPTLSLAGKGTVLGWDSLLRRVSTGSVRAAISTDHDDPTVLTLALSADEFEAMTFEYLMPVLAQRCGVLELFDTLSHYLSSLPTQVSGKKLREIVQYVEREQLVTVQHWHPERTTDLHLDSDRIWLVSGGAPVSVTIGTPIGSTTQLIPVRSSRFPVRLLGVDRGFLSSTLLGETSDVSPSLHLPLLTGVAASPNAATSIAPSSDPHSRPTAKDYPIWRSVSAEPIEDIVACFGMICDQLQVPYRPDSLRRWLTERPVEKFEPLDLCLRIAQAIGLNAHMVRFTPTQGGINRLNTPAIVRCRDIFTVLHEVTSTQAILGSPRTGLLRLTSKDLAYHLVPTPPPDADRATLTCWAIVLERLPQTPVKRFGFHWFLPLIAAQRGVLVQVLIASMFVQLLGLANPLLIQQVIDKVIGEANLGAMSMFGVLMVVFAVLEGILTILRTYLLASTTHRLDLRLGIEIVRHLTRQPLHFFEKRPVGELSSRLSELENIRQFLTGTALTAVLDVIFSLFYIAVMFLYSPQLTLCVLATIPIAILSTLVVAAIQRRLIRTRAEHGSQVQSYLVEVLGGIFTVKAQHMESLVEATWRERYVHYLSSGFTISTIGTIFSSFSQFLNTSSSLLVLWVGAGLALQGQLTLGGLIAFRILSGYVTGPLLRLARLWQRFQETSLSMELLADIIDAPTEEQLQEGSFIQLPPIEGYVQYHQVDFGFKPGKLQLTHVDLDIPAGSFVGVVGQSGSGKSTLMKLLPRLYLPQSGSIAIDGYEVSKVNLSSLRQQIGIVPQDAVLFEGTIRDNIALFGDMSDDAVIEAAKVAEAHDFIMQLPEGYNTQVGERGGSLSGGQRQRIAIARVVARNPRLLIFDEATSALDYETERRVCENLMQRFQHRTVFFITHRLTTIMNADWILFMQSGAIVEQGTHQELMARRQLYYCLFTQQSRQ